jgi:uncharacterized phage-associated protein
MAAASNPTATASHPTSRRHPRRSVTCGGAADLRSQMRPRRCRMDDPLSAALGTLWTREMEVSVAAAWVEHMFESVRARLIRRRRCEPYDGGMVGSAQVVAVEIRRRLPDVGKAKLHKLLYYAQGHHLAAVGRPLFSDTISAWDKGPVVGTLWHAEHHDVPAEPAHDLDEAALNTIGYVLSRYGGMTGSDLIRLSHGESPWLKADDGRVPGRSVRIPVQDLLEYFSSAHEDDDESGPPLDEDILEQMLAGASDRLQTPARVDSLDALRRRRTTLLG